ncbi:MAG: F0F1 ATP synthase subunit epsilon [Firmicutes bacterium]|uniref:ATP synthase epsilon chain n=1 Tax=Melghirimyces thermohalophilus TaxID=1236220 RepID=A0A1G6MBV8_9BACL|nr:F0F1 ATP synthase subunit epsilon [Melghirimyces thermohalophilus]MDA8353768.1 F0F1 ATP synthase subunit epsilon [Bacillota bacterium]SDC53062.1 F-type H+-transporting ATPase subunit epsilon [Melghirimyces thermohalophilus]
MSTMQLDIVTPERKVYSEQVDMVIARAVEGDIGILPNHSPYVSPLAITAVRVKKDEEEFLVAVSGGFIEVRGGTVTVLAETAELPDEIDVDRAEAAKKRAEERLADKQKEGIDFRRAEIALMKAKNRLRVSQNG